jgi:formylglycine-generating enzyme required for sulfatase activity
MIGNAAEWTRTTYRSYPYAADGRDDGSDAGKKVVRGGSWYHRPLRARSAFREHYQPWQGVYSVGFRVIAAG